MQPKPSADTSRLPLPSLRVCMSQNSRCTTGVGDASPSVVAPRAAFTYAAISVFEGGDDAHLDLDRERTGCRHTGAVDDAEPAARVSGRRRARTVGTAPRRGDPASCLR